MLKRVNELIESIRAGNRQIAADQQWYIWKKILGYCGNQSEETKKTKKYIIREGDSIPLPCLQNRILAKESSFAIVGFFDSYDGQAMVTIVAEIESCEHGVDCAVQNTPMDKPLHEAIEYRNDKEYCADCPGPCINLSSPDIRQEKIHDYKNTSQMK